MSERHQKSQPLLTVTQVAERLSVSPSLIYRLVDSGNLAVCRIGNGRGAIRFRPEDVEHYIESTRRQTDNTPVRKNRPRLKHIHL